MAKMALGGENQYENESKGVIGNGSEIEMKQAAKWRENGKRRKRKMAKNENKWRNINSDQATIIVKYRKA